MAEVEELCDELTVLDRGAVVYSGGVEELRLRAPASLHLLHTSDDHAAHSPGSSGADRRVSEGGARRVAHRPRVPLSGALAGDDYGLA